MAYGAVSSTAPNPSPYSSAVPHECEYIEIAPSASSTPDDLLRTHGSGRRGAVGRRVAGAVLACAGVVALGVGVSYDKGGAGVRGLGGGASSPTTTLGALQAASSYVTYESPAACTSNCGGDDLVFPHEVYSVAGHLEYTLEVNTFRYQGPVSVNMRAYDGKVAGPTLVASPGDTVTLHLKNSLEVTSADSPVLETQSLFAAGALDTSSCEVMGATNMTSLHFQGMLLPSSTYQVRDLSNRHDLSSFSPP